MKDKKKTRDFIRSSSQFEALTDLLMEMSSFTLGKILMAMLCESNSILALGYCFFPLFSFCFVLVLFCLFVCKQFLSGGLFIVLQPNRHNLISVT